MILLPGSNDYRLPAILLHPRHYLPPVLQPISLQLRSIIDRQKRNDLAVDQSRPRWVRAVPLWAQNYRCGELTRIHVLCSCKGNSRIALQKTLSLRLCALCEKINVSIIRVITGRWVSMRNFGAFFCCLTFVQFGLIITVGRDAVRVHPHEQRFCRA